ncbi:nuclear transport factor 2 family protein [Mycobacterium sp. ITM-2016-00318]|uniref:nuclear transport factor 2 family protein n=1 Tax=Mycobacterium sp. ITM-2016-00318 TaxID=2099693 RepID=UPI000CFA60A4|nr:nuclear transport factor 2 family protein [Mycobacterium sp. ITM-2016-00318]WNG94257.1 nuclear transport factor 2 family protein [Mycobacterium sp. ITM-2016-00318]
MNDSVLPQPNLRSTVEDVADRLFTAIEKGDAATVEALWDADVLVWKSAEPEEQAKNRAMRVIAWFMDSTSSRRYEILDRQFFDGGFVQQHVLHAAGKGGGSISLRVCIVIKVGMNGLITKIDEYFDPAELEPLLRRRK